MLPVTRQKKSPQFPGGWLFLRFGGLCCYARLLLPANLRANKEYNYYYQNVYYVHNYNQVRCNLTETMLFCQTESIKINCFECSRILYGPICKKYV